MTNNTTFSGLVAQLKEIMATGSDEQARTFITDHINDFPEHVRDDIALALFEEALREGADDAEDSVAIQTEVLEEAEEIATAKLALEDKLKMKNLKEGL